ncbi:DUF1841 family protein [Thiocystis violacea]|uniref:DUF1841 family protein n=1 Tax=Thiocystis violacea TaxID=13725 RepID=UPI001907A332|nr:DUF1841 family protein [Thiocystis violacea]MBK1720985.1 hypothetical protein [Thiocystis violacea]
MFSGNRQSHRRVFIEAWRKASNGEPLEPLEHQIAELVRRHPEYQRVLEAGDAGLDQDFSVDLGQPNPFFHLGLHLAVIEQLSIDQPRGIRALYQSLLREVGDQHSLDHRIMECLTQMLWMTQQGSGAFDEQAYLDCIKGAGRA